MLPPKILPDLAWSFTVPTPPDFDNFLFEVREYGTSVHVPVIESELSTRFPLAAVDVHYKYSVLSSGKWVDVPAIVHVRLAKSPSYAELLYEIHRAVYEHLQDEDHCFFEGLWLREGSAGVPAYDMYLGS
jgi:hypothetical protein